MVIAIIGILASLIIVSLQGAGVKARDTKAKSNAANVDKALGQYEIDNNQLFPSAVAQASTLVGLAGLVPNYLKTASALTPVTGKAAQYISNYARTSYAQAWELENTTEAAITTGNGIYGTNSANAGGVVATPAKGSAISFNGTTVTIADSNPAYRSNNFTVSFWVKPNTAASANYILVHKYALSGWRVYLTCNGATCTPSADYPISIGTASGAAISPNVWSHIVVTYTSGSVIVYVNGTPGTPANIAYGIANSTNGNSVLMGFGGGLTSSNGVIDGLRLYNQALNSTEVGYLCNVSGTTCLGSYGSSGEIGGKLVGGWRLDEGTGGNGTGLASYSTTVNNGTLTVLGSGSWTAGNSPLGLTGIGSSQTGKAFVTYR